MEEIDYLRKQINLCKDVPELMGIEGNIRKVYYDSWNIIINQDIAFEKRVKNPPDNAINSLISYVNTIIYTRVLSEIYKTQLNPTISYLHEPSERRFSLCLDIAEIFKPIIADRLIFSMLNKKQITEKDFEDTLDVVSKVHFEQVYMFIYSRRVGTPADKMENQIPDEVKHERFDRLKKLAESQIEGNNQKYVNTIQKVLVEGKSKTNENMLTGRTDTNKVVNFEGTDDMIGKIINLKIVSEHMWYLKGEVQEN